MRALAHEAAKFAETFASRSDHAGEAMRRGITLLVTLLACEPTERRDEGEPLRDEPSSPATTALPMPATVWKPGPGDPHALGLAEQPRLVRLTAHWCAWCGIFEHDVLVRDDVRRAIARDYEPLEIDVDEHPRWLDLAGIEGLPALVFFDARGHHVLSRSGYRSGPEVVALLDAVARGLQTGEIAPFPDPPARRRLGEFSPIDAARAQRELERIEGELYLHVNSNDGGFGTPARYPHPLVLLELQGWAGRSERSEQWIVLTLKSALRGSSPRLSGEALPGFDMRGAELIEVAVRGAAHPRWRTMIEDLPSLDPYRGLQDPIDHGVFRYCAGPGWYHPHFERLALDNMAWALLLRERGELDAAADIDGFIQSTFVRDGGLDAGQRANPVYFRLRADEREGVAAPEVAPLQLLEVQALAGRWDAAACASLLDIPTGAWPRSRWPEPSADEATPDAFGELLVTLSGCPGEGPEHARALAKVALQRWQDEGLVVSPRLGRLAAGICGALPKRCADALAGVEGLPLDLDVVPPLQAFARFAASP